MSQPDHIKKQPLEADADYDVHPLERRTNAPPPIRQQRVPPKAKEDQPYLTYLLIFVNVVVFAMGFLQETVRNELFLSGWLYPPQVLRGGEFYRLLTSMFLHADPAHIFFNMYALYIVGSSLEPLFGRVRYLLIYFLGGLAGSVLSVTLGNYATPSVGASGAVFALFAAEMLHYYQNRNIYNKAIQARLKNMAFVIGLQVVLGFLPGSRIDNWGHIGGALGGLFLTWRIGPRLQKPDTPVKITSLRDISKLDSNRLTDHLPELVLFCFALVGIMFFAVNVVGIGVIPQ